MCIRDRCLTDEQGVSDMSMIESIILGLVQGLAEFLPISSSGHLAALQHFFGISSDNVLTFTVMLHFGTLIAIFVAYWKDIVDLVDVYKRQIQLLLMNIWNYIGWMWIVVEVIILINI